MMMGLLAFESNQGGYYSQLFGIGGVMITVAILVLSTGYFGGIGAPFAPYFLLYLGQLPKKKERKRPVRVYMDGCFDLMHYGHANALRQAKLLGDQLIVGVVSDEEIVANKGPPVLSMEERLTLVSGLKWVDEVIPNAPYEITEDFMNTLFNKYSIDYIIHGDDPCLLPDGTDAYALAKKVGRYKQIKRTEGVSSTDIVGRILLTFKQKDANTDVNVAADEKPGAESRDEVRSQLSHFLPTSRRIMQFSNGQAPSPGARVVYVDGAFDLFHAGHVEILRSARQLGDFLLVGIHDDQAIRDRRGYRPIMHLHERTLSVLACRYVDEVIIGAPWEVSKDMITTFNISLVVHGTVAEGNSAGETDPYAVPKSMGIFKTITSPKTITSVSVATRIVDNHEAYKKRNLKKPFIEPFGLTLIEAAAYGLPMVATRNGGPVDIHRVLDNGILVDPHNQNEIAEALYKLVSDKHLWAQCRQNGLKNIHQFSWPEHCKNYLSRVGTLKPRHPRWQNSDDATEVSEADSPGDSLRDIHDISLNLKISLDSEKSASKEGNSSSVRRHLEDAVQKLSRGVSSSRKDGSGDNAEATTGSNKWPSLRRRKHIIVIAVDCVQDADFVQIIKNIFAASSNERLTGAVGFVLSTSRAISEIHALLVSKGIETSDFDAFICNSGSDVCYPSSSSEDMLSPAELPFMIDLDYHSQIEYHWGGEGLRKTLIRWAAEKNNESGQKIVVEDEECSSTYCISFKVKNTEAVPPVKELRRTMRIQALRCHVLYSHDGSKLNVIPVLASRSQALRYLYIRWGVQLSNMTVIVGESGDTDYEGLLGGAHKTIILEGSFNAAPNHVHAARSYSLQDVVSFEKPGIASVEGYGSDNLKSALQQFGILKDQNFELVG